MKALMPPNMSSRKQKLIICIFLAAAILAVFAQVRHFDFVSIDDEVYVTQNIQVKNGISPEGVIWAFLTTFCEFWHPLTWLSLMLDSEIYGMRAGGYHLTNLLLHIFSTLLLFGLLCRMTAEVWKSAFVAGFFALHPLHVESVAWIAERKDVLSGFFWMLTLYWYGGYARQPNTQKYLLTLSAFIGGLMSKSMVVTLPVVMLLLDYWPLNRVGVQPGKRWLWLAREKAPFFVFSAIFSVITLLARQNLTAKNYALIDRAANAPVSFIVYLEKTFWPLNLAVFYPFPEQMILWRALAATIVSIAAAVAVIRTMKRYPWLFVGWFWYAVVVFPVLGFIQVGRQGMADRFTYLPLVGIGIMLAWGLPSLFPKKATREKILVPAAIVFLGMLSLISWKQCGYWKNGKTLYVHALQATRNNYLAFNNLGLILSAEGDLQEAIRHYDKAIDICDNDVLIYNNRGKAYAELGWHQRALEDFSRATALQPGYADSYGNRGMVYAKLGMYRNAIADLDEAIRLDPFYADYYARRAMVYLTQKNNKKGCADAQAACVLGSCFILNEARKRKDCLK